MPDINWVRAKPEGQRAEGEARDVQDEVDEATEGQDTEESEEPQDAAEQTDADGDVGDHGTPGTTVSIADEVDTPNTPDAEEEGDDPRPDDLVGKFGRFTEDGTPRVSPSQIRRVLTCGARWRYKYLDGREEPTSASMAFGTVIHNVVEEALRRVLDGGEPPSTDEMVDRVKDYGFAWFTDPEKTAEIPDEEMAEVDPRDLAQEAGESMERLWTWYLEQDLTPVDVEMQVNKTLTVEGVEVVNRGYPDAFFETEDGRRVVLDWKTSNRSPSILDDEAEWDVVEMKRNHAYNALVYADALQQEGVQVDEVWIVYVVRNKTPVVRIARKPLSEGMLGWARRVTVNGVQRILHDQTEPNPFGAGWRCSSDYCAFWDICPGSTLKMQEESDE